MEILRSKGFLWKWAIFCLLAVFVGIAIPVTKMQSIGLEGANQANLLEATDELTSGKLLEFVLEPPTNQAEQIGFFFTTNKHVFTDGILSLTALDAGQNQVVGKQEFALRDLEEDQFLFVKLERTPKTLKVQIETDALENGPSIWLNETTKTPGSAIWNQTVLDKSLVYNLLYTEKAHQFIKPLVFAWILFIFGMGIDAAGGFAGRLQKPSFKNSGQKIKKRFIKPTQRQIMVLFCIWFLSALLFYYLYDTRIRIAQNTTEKSVVLELNGETIPISKKNSFIRQTVKPKEDKLTGLGVRFYLAEGVKLTEGEMYASVTDLTLGQVLCETNIAASQFISGEYIGLLFHESQENVKEHEYQIDLVFSPELWDKGLEIFASEKGVCVNAYLYFNIFLKKFFFFMFLAVELFLALFWYLLSVKRAKLETIFLVTILFFGLIYNVMLTPQMVPDEAKHIDMAYRYSNELLGYPSLGDTKCLKRADDEAINFTSSPSLKNYRNIYYGLFSKVSDNTMVEAQANSNIGGSFLLYAPAVLGMSLSRILHLGTVPMLLLSRYFNLCVFALFVWAGMKHLPFGKMTLFVLALLPINLQQCTSFSHDAIVHGILFFYGSLCLEAIFKEKQISVKQMFLMELMAMLLVYCKNGSYLPLVFLPLLIPKKNFQNFGKWYMGMAALLAIPILTFLMKHMQMVTGIVETTASTSVVSTGNGTEYLTGYTIGYFLKEPLEFIYMMANTVFDKIGFYLESLVGYQLGWVEIETSMAVVILFWFLLFLTLCRTEEETVEIGKIQRFWMVFLCAGCMGLILMGMLLQWTPIGHVSIEGVQGRYFLPFMPILLAACQNHLLVLKRNVDRGIAFAAVAGQLLTLLYLIKQVTIV